MQVIVNSDSQINLNEELIEQTQSDVMSSLKRFDEWITRIEIQLSDQNSSAKGGVDDIRCLMEARPANRQPVSVEVRAASVDQAIQEGTEKLKRRLGAIVDKARSEQREKN